MVTREVMVSYSMTGDPSRGVEVTKGALLADDEKFAHFLLLVKITKPLAGEGHLVIVVTPDSPIREGAGFAQPPLPFPPEDIRSS